MRRYAVLDGHLALRPSDHVAWAGDGAAVLDAFAAQVFAGGAQVNEQLMFVADDPNPARLAALPGRDELLAAGTLQLVRTADVYGLDPDAQLAAFAGVLDAALGAGRSGLRVVADNTPHAQGDDADFDRWLAWEQLTDQFQATHPLIGVCYFDRTVVPHERIEQIAALHPVVNVLAEPPFRIFHDSGDAMRVVGELDNFSVRLLTRILETTPGTDELVVDLGDCVFLDHQTMFAFADYARRERPITLRNVSPGGRRLWDLVGRPTKSLRFR